MDFIAIDFETANEKRNSACSIGITKVIDDNIVEEKYWLIKPPEMRFMPQNIWIHGIYPEDVENENTFEELWDEIEPYIDGQLIVAHNASFDISVLRSLLDFYNIKYPSFYYVCTVILAQNHLPNLKNHKLNTVAEFVGHEFKHHHAGEDATACAKVMNYICNIIEIEDLVSLNLRGAVSLGIVYPGGFDSCKSLIKGKNKTKKEAALKDVKVNYETDYFKGKVVVFTGPLFSMKRSEAYVIIKKLGGEIGTSVTRKTQILITGIKARNNDEKYKSTKLRKAELLISEGQCIEMLTEEEFLELSLNIRK